jgi:SAM-dependent methyltransferase
MTRCPICRQGEFQKLTAVESRTLLICAQCRHTWWESFPPDAELAEYYRRQYTSNHDQAGIQERQRTYYRSHLEDLLQLIRAKPSATAIVDYGCSIPTLLDEARQLGFRRAVGVDYGSEAASFAEARGFEILPPSGFSEIADESLDIARFSHILEHTINPVAVLAQVVEKVRAGGLVYITQPNFPVFRAWPAEIDLKDAVYPEHLHFFSPLSLVTMAVLCGLEIRRVFSHQNEADAMARYSAAMDLDYARDRLEAYAEAGDAAIPELGNYPYYAGENSCLYAFRRCRTASAG